MKKILTLLLALAMTFSLVACGGEEADANAKVEATGTPSTGQGEALPTPLESADASFTSNDGVVTGLDVIQVMGKGLNTDTGELFEMTKFVAGKDSVINVSFAKRVDVEQDGSMLLTIAKDGVDLIELMPMSSGYEGTSALFTPKKMEDVNSWEAGAYTFHFTMGDSTASRTVRFGQAKSIKVLAVPVIANYAGRIVSCEGEWQTAIQFTRDTYPIAKDGIEYVLGNEIDLSGAEFDLTTDEGQYNVWAALCSLQTPQNDYELILGFVRERQGAEANVQGYTYGKPANIITESDGDMQPTVAHEIAHCYNIGDEYPGGAINNLINPAPYGMEGSDYNNRDQMTQGNKEAVLSANEYGNENSGSILLPEQLALNTAQMIPLENAGSFMGSGSANLEDYWITSDIWNHLYKVFVENMETSDAGAESGGNAFTCAECNEKNEIAAYLWAGMCDDCGEFTEVDLAALAESFDCGVCQETTAVDTNTICGFCPVCQTGYTMQTISDGMDAQSSKSSKVSEVPKGMPENLYVLDISGTVYADGTFKVNPWYGYEGDSSLLSSKRSGGYSVVMEDAAGKQLSRQYFDVSFYTQSNPPKKVDVAPLEVTVSVPVGTAVIRILQGKTELYATQVSANSPKIEITSITEDGQTLDGKQTVAWTGSDADGGTIYYELWYCTENGDFTAVASDITKTSFTVDFGKLPGSKAGYFFLYATDGVNTGECNSYEIQVPFKAPEIISEQKTVPDYKLTDEIVFDADVYDMQDGWLYTSDEMSWSYDGQGYTTGSLLWIYPFELTPGKHEFIMTATNSEGVSASRTYAFNILNDESALPQDWSKDDVKQALSNGFVAPLKNVSAAMTRGQFAKLMNTLYWQVWEEGSPDPDYEEGIVTDCGADDYAQFLMVKLGVMDAKDGKFKPNGQLTEQEAATIMYQVLALSDPNLVEPSTDAQIMVDSCISWGVMDESGENSYSADKPITGQLALVRCNRLYEAIFVTE